METNNEKLQKKRAESEKELKEFRKHELERAYREVMQLPAGRRVLMNLIRMETTIEGDPMRNGAFQTAYELGRREMASDLYATLRLIDIELYQEMEREYCKDRELERKALKMKRLENQRRI